MNSKSLMVISSIGSGLIIFFVFIFLFHKDKEKYLGIIALGWGVFIIQRLLRFLGILKSIETFSFSAYVLYLVLIFLFIYGIHLFIRKPVKKWWVVVLGICIVYKSLDNIINLPNIIGDIIYIFPSIILVWNGINVIKSKKYMGIGRHIVGGDFIFWGIQLIFFSFFKNKVWFITIAKFIYPLIFNVLAFGILISYFETILKRLEKSEERYKMLVEICPDAIGVVMNNEIVFANNASLRLLKADNMEQVKGHKIKKFLHPDFLKNEEERFEKLFVTSEALKPKEIKLKTLEGIEIEVESAIAPIAYNNRRGVLFVARDIAERKKSESLKKRIEEKTILLEKIEELEKLRNEFFANISHDLRTPLNIILGTIQLIEMNNTNISVENKYLKEKKRIKTIKQNCYRLLRLVNNLIDITKIDAGFYKTNLQNCNIVNVIENITLSVVDYTKNKDISLVFDTDIEEKIIACDLDKIERIMMNLLSNAIKFTREKGSILVKIKDDIDNITIIVKDNGIGIPEEKKEIVFERFKQVENTLSRSCEGSGIGLSLVKSLVEMHGGTISVESELLKGTEFIIKLPVQIIPEKEIEKDNNFSINQTLIERISIEFSDIYSA
ncbi:PAS domain-containing sensor histidine kinase [Maledivibacter halophilus]|uniref:histidine kinase n=1 Tax=Maledivibacter halophilus TaxID=36842 RepID=A0A1T5M5J1_9FIRM|nr:PAS domain-containing sensor histidine kinase [Maledivibacter halophilus]SKC83502.1 PAS domain S-box-containing protein [Maledivibacter halophilus]